MKRTINNVIFTSRKLITVFAILALMTVAAKSFADVINLSSGVNSSGQLQAGGTNDIHWKVYNNNTLIGPAVVLTNLESDWATDSKAKWISIKDSVNPNPNGSMGYWADYRVTFDLSKYNLSTVKLTGNWTADEGGYAMLNNMGSFSTSYSKTQLSSFNVTSGFIQGINTIDFNVMQYDNFYDGSIIEMYITATPLPTAVPEPDAVPFFIMGSILLTFVIVRKNRTQKI